MTRAQVLTALFTNLDLKNTHELLLIKSNEVATFLKKEISFSSTKIIIQATMMEPREIIRGGRCS